MRVSNTAILCNNMTNSILASHKSPLYHKVENNFSEIIKAPGEFPLKPPPGMTNFWDKAPLSYKQWPDQYFFLISSTGLIDLLNMQSVTDNNAQTKQIHPNNSNVETRKRLHQQRQDLTLKYGWYLHQFSACREEKKTQQ